MYEALEDKKACVTADAAPICENKGLAYSLKPCLDLGPAIWEVDVELGRALETISRGTRRGLRRPFSRRVTPQASFDVLSVLVDSYTHSSTM
jgi:hypothetical protein